MEDRGDAVRDRLPVAVDQRDVDREIDLGPRHHLPFERVAMQVDDAGQYQQVARIERDARARSGRTGLADFDRRRSRGRFR